MGVIYSGLEQRGRGFLLNLFGILLSLFTASIILFLVIWMDSLIALITIFTFFWILVLNIPGLIKIINQEDVPYYCSALIFWASCIIMCTIIFTIIMVVEGQENFSKLYLREFHVGLAVSLTIGTLVAVPILCYITMERS